ncbi:DUF305 domain-containing protein [Hymenobacter rigui]|uniref:DUF305 domain-containing protein n=1 Tax=Hymenobacter rigui TaxID=334424 RepID=A0A3R9P4Z6_9BACT|nr:DUF305 domain-containing protein [Hymenobacter rigui]RSK48795.1 DUF305 domain-containing protein [Hymenobacter rigui]
MNTPHKPYRRFFLTLALSFGIMYCVMYLNTYALDHVYPSLTRLYMTVLMITPMAVIMLGSMHHMYQNIRLNMLIVGGSTAVFALALLMVRSQTLVDDRRWMQAMIPHHSIAILTSERATIKAPEVRQLADSIISTQKREIGEMKRLLSRLK